MKKRTTIGMKKKIEISSKLIEDEYMEHSPEEDDELYWCKESLKKILTPLERKIYVTYLENGTYTSTAKAFKVSTPTLQKYVKGLTARIAEYVCKHIK